MFAGRLAIAAGSVLFAASLVASAGAGEVTPTPKSDQDLFAGADALDVEELGDTIVRDVEVGPGAVPIATVTIRVGGQETTVLNVRQTPEFVPPAAVGVSVEERVTAVIEEIKATEEAEREAAKEAARLAAAEKVRKAAEKEARLAALERIRKAKEQAARLAAEEKARKAAEEAVRLAADEESRKAAEEAVAALAEDAARKAASGQVVVETAAVAETTEAAATAKATDAAAAEAAAVGEKLDVAAATTDSAATSRVKSLLSPEKAALLTEEEILALIVGNSMTGFTRGGWWTEYYAPDGTIRGKWRSRRYLAKWSVDRGLMCFDYAIDGRSFCLMLVVTDDQVFAFQEDGSGGDQSSRLLSGNPLNL